jgi:BA14K-like protein
MRLAVYGAVLVIALGSVLLGLDRLSAPMSPMIDTTAGLRAAAPPPTATQAAPSSPTAPAAAGAAAQAAAPVAAPESQVHCNVSACAAAYRSFRPSDCTYQPNDGPRRLCAK